HQWRVGGTAVRMLTFFGTELDIIESRAVEVRAQEPRDLVGILVGHEAEVDLSARLAGDDRLGAWPVVAGFDAADVAGRLEYGCAFRLDVASTEREVLDPDHVLRRLGVERHPLEHLALRCRRRPDVVVEALDQHSPRRVHERRERVSEPHRRVRIVRRSARVSVTRHGADAEVAIEDALAAERQERTALAIDCSALLERAIAAREVGLEREQLPEIRTAGFLFALDEEPNTDRQLAVDRAVRLDRLDAKEKMSLVVIDATRIHRAIAHRGVVRRRLPELERYGRLHVVVLDADERALT